jgi:hypothetical protein
MANREGLEIEMSWDTTTSRVYPLSNSPHQLVCLYLLRTPNPLHNTRLLLQVGQGNLRPLAAKDLNNTRLLSHTIIRTPRINTTARHTIKVTAFLNRL